LDFRVAFSTAASAIFVSLGIPIPHVTGSNTAASATQYNSILVLGGSSSVGASAVELLRQSLPSATIIATSSPAHNERLKRLGATAVVDYKAPTLVADIKAATPGGKGVDAIIDAVASGASEAGIFDALRQDGPKKYAEVATGARIQPPAGVNKDVVFGRTLFTTPGGEGSLNALGPLIAQGKFTIPLPVKIVGTGFEAIAKGLEQLKAGVSGTKLAVTL
jgi:NADPH:quinone reductase-like Zn-dependent oxidoreductase